MAKPQKTYICQSCGSVTSKWGGKCEACNEWNTIVEEANESAPKGLGGGKRGKSLELVSLKGESNQNIPRHVSGVAEFDRVTGGEYTPLGLTALTALEG